MSNLNQCKLWTKAGTFSDFRKNVTVKMCPPASAVVKRCEGCDFVYVKPEKKESKKCDRDLL